MSATYWSRWGALSGIAFAILFVIGAILPDLPGGGDSNAAVTEFYADSGNRLIVIIASYLHILAGLAFLAFLANLYRGLRLAEGDAGPLATIALGAGIVFIVMLNSASSAWANVPGGVEFGGEAPPGAEIPIWFAQLGYGELLLNGMFAAIAVIVPACLLALQTAVLPRWLAWTGFVCAAILVLGVAFIPMIALPIWVVAASVAMLKSPAVQPANAARTAPTAA